MYLILHLSISLSLSRSLSLSLSLERERERERVRNKFRLYHKTVVVVNALSARVTEGVPITSDITNTLSHLSGVLPIQIICIRLGLVKASHCNLPLPRITQSEKYVSLFVPEDYQK